MTDRTSKVLLAMIAMGLWANALVSILGSNEAVAQSISGMVGDISDIKSGVSALSGGTCQNSKLC
jgi:hypothetical protein